MRVVTGLVRPSLTGAAVLAGQLYGAIHREDLPSFTDQDPSGDFGHPATPPLRIVVLGDSSVTAPGIDIDASWARRLAMHFSDRYRVELRSVAVGGSKARDVVSSQLAPAIATGGHIAIISVGSNDAMRFVSVTEFEAELSAAVDGLSDHFPLVGVMGVGDLGTLPRLPALAKTIARSRGRSMDHAIRRVVANRPNAVKSKAWGQVWHRFDSDPIAMFSGDMFHASEEGHSVFAGNGIEVVNELLARWPSLLQDEPPRATEWPDSLESAM